MVLSFTKPGRGRIIVFSPKDTVTYDSVTGTGDVYVAGGSYIECAGIAGDSFTVRARPAFTGEKDGRSGR